MKPKDLGTLSKKLFALKDKKADFNTEITFINAEIKEIELELLDGLHEQNLTTLGDGTRTVYISKQTVPHVINWDALYTFVRENNAFEMLHRRVSQKAFLEYFEQGMSVPGIDPAVFDEIRTRKS